ncbi:mono-functional DNA-alkylating methyl methanesulfonate N-term-domain-containing protein [Xylaria telfairii]|nr:mono-functional DNA-alkylating methyl methanesulfonate N-term-domain-containing protein [Xylaria telfairii]
MASLQTQVLVNNEWVTQTVTAEELLKDRTKPAARAPPKPPNYGVLTKTVIKSPIVRWVLPVQLRSSRFNDVALVGDQSVQICELGSDLQLQPIAKVDFGSKIRNCRVMGTHGYLRTIREDVQANYNRNGNSDTNFSSPSTSPAPSRDIDIFQQMLVLVLCSGELVFLIMNLTALGDWEFVPSHFPIIDNDEDGKKGGMLVDPGFHMTMSPDGRYLTLACSENLLITYQLESIEKLRSQHARRRPMRPIQSVKSRAMKGVIYKLDFLHPGPEKASLVVLLIITVQSGVLKLATYEWESFQDALIEEKSGYRLDEIDGLPILIIPLTVCCQFLIIREHSMAICSNILSGPPDFFPFEPADRGKTAWHHGTHNPMWTAWTRPLREGSYHTDTDMIYLAREDGWINSLQISRESDVEGIYMGPLECNIDSGFASLSTHHGEIIIAGGDDGPGAIWLLHPRGNPMRISSLPSWSPTVDLILTKDAIGHSNSAHKKIPKRPSIAKLHGHVPAPDKTFVCSGRDKSGAIVELRYGIQAKIGLDLSYTSLIKNFWAIPSFDGTPEAGFFFLLALPENSALLHVSHDLEVSEKTQDTVDFDLLSTTLAVHISRNLVIQITAAHITILSPTSCYQHSISDMIEGPPATIIDSAVTAETLALSVYSQSMFKILVFTLDETRFVLTHTIDNLDGDVTALSLTTLSVGFCVLASILNKEMSALVVFPLHSPQPGGQTLSDTQQETIRLDIQGGEDADSTVIHAVNSIVYLGDEKIVIGKRNGDVLTIRLKDDQQTGRRLTVTRTNHFGVSSSRVFKGMVFDTGPSTLVCNDAGLAIMKEGDGQSDVGCFEEISRIWLTDANEPHAPSPTVSSVARLHEIPGYGDSTWAMLAGSRILITELQPDPAPIPRHMPIDGTPLEILYSERLEALVAVVKKSGIPSLHFFDPVTGTDLSHPIRKVSDQDDEQHVDVEYITSLGDSDVRIASLMSWRYKNIYEWFVILARSGHSQGRLLVVSAKQELVATTTGTSRKIRFWTQFHRKIKDGLLRCGTTDDDGLFLNFGKTLEYHVIEEKKFKTAMRYDLPSPATSLEVIDGNLHVLTTHHSVIILDYKSNAALKGQRMVELHTDEITRNGLHWIDVGPFVGADGQHKLILVSDPMCGVYGLWTSGQNSDNSNFRLVFKLQLTVSIRKFVSGYTRQRWARDGPRYELQQAPLDRRQILGLAIDGSLTQFSILREDTWRLLRYIQNLAMTSKDVCPVPGRYDITADMTLDPALLSKAMMHIDGDILQQCLEKRILERVVSTSEQIGRLQELLLPLGLSSDVPDYKMLDVTSLAYEHTYSILEYYLTPAL